MTSAPIPPSYLGIPFRILVSPFMPFDPEQRTTDILTFNSKNLGALIVAQEPHVKSWEDGEFNIQNMSIEEEYGLGILNEGQAIAVAKNVKIRPNEFVVPARTVYNLTDANSTYTWSPAIPCLFALFTIRCRNGPQASSFMQSWSINEAPRSMAETGSLERESPHSCSPSPKCGNRLLHPAEVRKSKFHTEKCAEICRGTQRQTKQTPANRRAENSNHSITTQNDEREINGGSTIMRTSPGIDPEAALNERFGLIASVEEAG